MVFPITNSIANSLYEKTKEIYLNKCKKSCKYIGYMQPYKHHSIDAYDCVPKPNSLRESFMEACSSLHMQTTDCECMYDNGLYFKLATECEMDATNDMFLLSIDKGKLVYAKTKELFFDKCKKYHNYTSDELQHNKDNNIRTYDCTSKNDARRVAQESFKQACTSLNIEYECDHIYYKYLFGHDSLEEINKETT